MSSQLSSTTISVPNSPHSSIVVVKGGDDPLTSSKTKKLQSKSGSYENVYSNSFQQDDNDNDDDIEEDRQEETKLLNGDRTVSVLLDEESIDDVEEEHFKLPEGKSSHHQNSVNRNRSSPSNNNNTNTPNNKNQMVQLHTQIPAYYIRIGKHMIVFIGIMIMCAILSGFVFRELTKNTVPYTKVGEYAYQQGTLIHGHFFSLGVFVPLTLVVLLFLSYVMTGEKVSSGMFHVGFIIYEIGAILALVAFCYKAGSFLTLIKNNPNANIHEFEMYTWGGTSSYGGRNDGTGDMSIKMIRMLYFAISHGFMLIGLFKCVIIVFISIFKSKKKL